VNLEKQIPLLTGKEPRVQSSSEPCTIDASLQAFDVVAEEAGCSTNLDVFYDIHRREYLVRNTSQWIPQSEGQFKRRLRSVGILAKLADGATTSPADDEILRIQDHCSVNYAGPLAGYSEGITEQNGDRVLITKSPVLIVPEEGGFDVLRQTIEAILDDPDHLGQLHYFFGWLQWAVSALMNGNLVPGQALVFAGPAGCGKSLLQNLLTIMFGGRSAKPYQFMTGGTDFNSELFGAEHLMIEDEAPSTDYRSRRKLGSFIKQITVNVDQRFHGKGRDALMLKPFWRLSISLNDEPEDLLILPPIDSGIEDKLIILRAFKRTFPMPTSTQIEKKSFWDTLCSEIPAFLFWLLNTYEIPASLVSDRFGITHFHNSGLIESLHATSPEAELLSLVDAHISLPFEGSAASLEHQLRETAGRQVDRLLSFNGAAGTYLSRLSKHTNPRVFKKRSAAKNLWRIIEPSASPPQQPVEGVEPSNPIHEKKR